jgi:hypothetical protein
MKERVANQDYFAPCDWENNMPFVMCNENGQHAGPLVCRDASLVEPLCKQIRTRIPGHWMPSTISLETLGNLIVGFGEGVRYWEYLGNGRYALCRVPATVINAWARNRLMQEEFTPVQMLLAREAWETIGHYFNPIWEEFERLALSEPRVTYQLRIWVCCSRAWKKYFANHPQSQSDHAKRTIASHLLAASLGDKPMKRVKHWDELVSLYQEEAKQMGLPPCSPPKLIRGSAEELSGER